jgi:ATP-dependent helicase/nuclease subunit A
VDRLKIESCILNASAGAGKTRSIINQICDLLHHGVSPSKIVCISFTKNSTANIQKRLITTLEKQSYINISETVKSIRFFTVHSFCSFILRKFIKESPVGRLYEEFSYDDLLVHVPIKNFSIIDHFSLHEIGVFIKQIPEEILTQCSIRGINWYKESLSKIIEKLDDKNILSKESQKIMINHNSQIVEIGLFLKNYRIYQKGVYLFDDLVANAYKSLYLDEKKEWFIYSMCKDIDHMFIDESQDISPLQWKILLVFINEVFHDHTKSFFISGDEKQSIFSFQNADFDFFCKILLDLENKAIEYKLPLRKVSNNCSSRNPIEIIKIINTMFLKHPIFQISKQFTKKKHFGVVDCVEILSDSSIGNQIASFIRKILYENTFLQSKKRPVRPSDFLVLFRRRGSLMESVNDSLLKYNIESSGVDKVYLFSSPCCIFILDLLKLCVDPSNDLSLIRLIQNYPFFIYIEHEINHISLWRYVSQKIEFPLEKMINSMYIYASSLSPYNFLYKIFFDFRVYYTLIEAKDQHIVHEILGIAADSQYLNIWSFLENFPKNVKQQQSSGVRLSTIHAAKGNQSSIVIIADSTEVHSYNNIEAVFENDLIDSQLKVPIFNISKEKSFFTLLRQRAIGKIQKESYREFYVALTRTEDFVFLFGKRPICKGSWYQEISKHIKKSNHIKSF